MSICHIFGCCPGSLCARPRINRWTNPFPLSEIISSDHFNPGFAFVTGTSRNSGELCQLFQCLWNPETQIPAVSCWAGAQQSMVSLFFAQIRVVLCIFILHSTGLSLHTLWKRLLCPKSQHRWTLAAVRCASLSSVLQPLSDKVHWNVDLKKKLLSLSFHGSWMLSLAWKCKDSQWWRIQRPVDPRSNPFGFCQIQLAFSFRKGRLKDLQKKPCK